MFYKKTLLFLLLICVFAIHYFYDNSSIFNEKDIETISNDTLGPTIENNIPYKCQEYIVSRPNIKIKYHDESGIDTPTIKLFLNYKDVTEQATISNTEINYTPSSKLKRGTQIVRLEINDLSSNKNTTSFEWCFIVGTPIYHHYRGLLHSHTNASDGNGSFNDAYYLARDKANLDFFAITEHSNMLDNSLDCTINNSNASKEWSELISSQNMFTLNNKFIALKGFEMTYPYKIDNPIGHINIFNSNGFVSENHPNMDLNNFYKFIYKQKDLIGQFNHPCDKFGNFNDFKYCPYGDSAISLVEVGNGYNKDISKNILSFDMYQLALDNGWHLAPTCNQDNHRVNFGIANEFRTVILATDLNQESIYDALKNMRVYATQDKNLKIDYCVNDFPMGSTISKSSKFRFYISAIDTDLEDTIKEIHVISNNGEIIKKKKFNSNLAKLEFSLKDIKNKFYYVKIVQANDKISVTAPIWIK